MTTDDVFDLLLGYSEVGGDVRQVVAGHEPVHDVLDACATVDAQRQTERTLGIDRYGRIPAREKLEHRGPAIVCAADPLEVGPASRTDLARLRPLLREPHASNQSDDDLVGADQLRAGSLRSRSPQQGDQLHWPVRASAMRRPGERQARWNHRDEHYGGRSRVRIFQATKG
jgi:hypothetical protein